MLLVGNAVYLLVPSPSKARILHPGEVIESDPTSFAAKFEDPITPAVESDVNAFCEVNGKFFQQGAVVTELRPGPGNVISFRRSGEPVSAEARQTYRVSAVTADFTAQIDKFRSCPVVDISPEGFAAIVSDRLNIGSLVKAKVSADGLRRRFFRPGPNRQGTPLRRIPLRLPHPPQQSGRPKFPAATQRGNATPPTQARARSRLVFPRKRRINRLDHFRKLMRPVVSLPIDEKRRSPVDSAPRAANEIALHRGSYSWLISASRKVAAESPSPSAISSSIGRLSDG